MGKYEQLAKDILKQVGGKENIISMTHCITRLRFQLQDESKANDDVLKKMDGVVTVIHASGQYQVVIGNHVGNVYADLCEAANLNGEQPSQEAEEKKGVFNRLIDIISGCFQPILGPICAAGMVKGLNALFVFLHILSVTDGTYIVLNAIGDSVFYFMPIMLGYTSARKFKLNPVTGMIIGATLCHSSIQTAALTATGALGTLPILGEYFTTFLRIPLIANTYTSSVVPIIIVNAFAGKVEKQAKKWIPEMLRSFFVPFSVLLVSVPLGLLVIGPVITILTNLLSSAFTAIYTFNPVIMGLTVGLFWQVLVIFGLHWALIPLMVINMTQLGYDNVLVGNWGACFAQTAVVAAMYFKLKDKKLKNLCPPAIISGVCGVTEPAIYGITLPKKKPFFYSLVGAGIGGAIMGLFDVKKYTSGGIGIFGIINYIDPQTGEANGMMVAGLVILISMLVSFLLTFFFWKDEEVAEAAADTAVKGSDETPAKSETHAGREEILIAPADGKVIPLNEVKDEAFSQGVLGKGVAILPENGRICSPVNGTVQALFPTLHALGLVSEEGTEVLIHVGINTVELNGEGFTAHVAAGDTVKKGQLLLEFNRQEIEAKGYCMETPVLITNSDEFREIVITEGKEIREKETLMILKK